MFRLLAIRLLVAASVALPGHAAVAAPILWTIERENPGGIDVVGSFVYDQAIQAVTNVDVRTGPSVDPEAPFDDFGVLRQSGAVYTTAVALALGDESGRLAGILFGGTAPGAPGLNAYYYFELFDPTIGDDLCGLLCRYTDDGRPYSIIGSTFAGELVCADGLSITPNNKSCGGLDFDLSRVASYRFNVGGADGHRIVGSPVPIPGALWLFAGGIGLLGLLAKRAR